MATCPPPGSCSSSRTRHSEVCGMWKRIEQVLLAELLGLAAFVAGGLAGLGAVMTWGGDSRHHPALWWSLVGLFAAVALFLARKAFARLRRAFVRVGPADARR